MRLLDVLPIFESRKNPTMNPRLSAYEQLKRYKDDPNIFISFTEINKIGINPLSTYDTPLGIYFYPLKETWEKYEVDLHQSFVRYPFANTAPYIQVIKWNGTGRIIDDLFYYHDEDLQDDINRLKSLQSLPFCKELSNDDIKDLVDLEVKASKQYSSQRLPASQFFYICLQMARIGKPNKKFSKKIEPSRNDEPYYQKFEYVSPSQTARNWNTLLRMLGYACIIDRTNHGIIHENEKIQGFFTSKEYLTHIKTIDNYSHVNEDLLQQYIDSGDLWDILKLLKGKKRPDLLKKYPQILNNHKIFSMGDKFAYELLQIFETTLDKIPYVIDLLKKFPYYYWQNMTQEYDGNYFFNASQKSLDILINAMKKTKNKDSKLSQEEDIIKTLTWMVKKDKRWLPLLKSSKSLPPKLKNSILHHELF
jgi:hypothetical protein